MWENELKEKLAYLNDLVLDVYIDKDKKAYLIECNPGKIYGSCGSHLFEWLDDYDRLTRSNVINLRFYLKTEKTKEIEK